MKAKTLTLPMDTPTLRPQAPDDPYTLILAWAPLEAARSPAIEALRKAHPRSHFVASSACPPHQGLPTKDGEVVTLIMRLQRTSLSIKTTTHPCPAIQAQELLTVAPGMSSGILLSTHEKTKAPTLHQNLAALWPANVPLVGGVAGGAAWVRVDDEILEDGAVLLAFDGVEMAVGLACGFAPGETDVEVRQLTKGTVGRVNGDVAIRGLMDAINRPMSRPPKHLPISPEGDLRPEALGAFIGLEDTNPGTPISTTLDADSGALFRLWHASSAALLNETRKAAATVSQAMPKPEALLVVACEGRRDLLREDFESEFKYATQPFPGVPTAGFCGYGESACVEGLPHALYWHCVIAGLRER